MSPPLAHFPFVKWSSLGVICLFLCVRSAALPGQEWKIPPDGAVEYRRKARRGAGALARSRREAASSPIADRVPARYFPGVEPAPWLCAGELLADRRGVSGPVRDLRDVLRAVAFDRHGRAVRLRLARVLPYGDLVIGGVWRAQGDGCEILTAKVTGRPPAGQRGEDRNRTARLRAFCVGGTRGTIEMVRRCDDRLGIVRTFAGAIDVVVEEGKRGHRRLRAEEEWEFVAVRENQDADFRRRVAEAIRRGAAFVRDAIASGRGWLDGSVRDQRSYGSGRLALSLLTLLHALVPPDDEVVVAGFRQLRRRRIVDTYSLAAALMAMARRGTAPGGGLADGDRKVAVRWLRALLANVDSRVEPPEQLRFNYVAGPRCDTSVQQYGLLGLAAARRCGLEVDGALFAAAARQLLAVQGPPTGRGTLRLLSYGGLHAMALGASDAETRVTALRRGFAYADAGEPAFGSMTAAGTSGLLLARHGMEAAGFGDRGLERRIDAGIRDGFAWLAAHLSLRCNPGWAERGRFHWYYWLYCLERSCELDRVARLGGRDWYYEGALQLIAQQRPSGAFRSGGGETMQIDATCFAILFLAKAAGRAAITQR